MGKGKLCKRIIGQIQQNLGNTLQKSKLKEKEDWESIFNKIDAILGTCEDWENIEEKLNLVDNELNILTPHFWNNDEFKEEAFENIDNFQDAIDELAEFYEDKKEEYSSKYSQRLVNMVRRLLYMKEKNLEWFGEDGSLKVIKKIEMIAEKCYCYDKQEDDAAREQIFELKMLIYNFKNIK